MSHQYRQSPRGMSLDPCNKGCMSESDVRRVSTGEYAPILSVGVNVTALLDAIDAGRAVSLPCALSARFGWRASRQIW